jgi:hypothetical protein
MFDSHQRMMRRTLFAMLGGTVRIHSGAVTREQVFTSSRETGRAKFHPPKSGQASATTGGTA